MQNNYKSFNLFNDVENQDLQTWNRCATMYNIMRDHGSKLLSEYVLNFTANERNNISKMFDRIKNNGYDKVRAEVNRNGTTA